MRKYCQYCSSELIRRAKEGNKTWAKRKYHVECFRPAMKKLQKGFHDKNNIIVNNRSSQSLYG